MRLRGRAREGMRLILIIHSSDSFTIQVSSGKLQSFQYKKNKKMKMKKKIGLEVGAEWERFLRVSSLF